MKIQTIAFTKIQLAFSLYFCQFFDPFQHGVLICNVLSDISRELILLSIGQ